MLTSDQIANGLLRSPAGCDAILNIANNPHLPIEHFAQPKVSFHLLSAAAIKLCDIHQGIPVQDLALRHGQTARETAEEISRNPAFSWWFAPLDMDSQVISQPYLNSRLRDDAAAPNIPPDLNAWRTSLRTSGYRGAKVFYPAGRQPPSWRLMRKEPRITYPISLY